MRYNRQLKYCTLVMVGKDGVAMELLDESFYKLIDFLPIPILVSQEIGTNAHGHLISQHQFVNRAFVALIGYTLQDIPTRDDWFRCAYPDPQERYRYAQEWQRQVHVLQSQQLSIVRTQARVYCKDGVYRWFEIFSETKSTIKPHYHVVAFIEITHLRAEISHLAALSQRDPLTNCLNRRGMLAALEQQLPPERMLNGFSIVLCDIDHFKHVNDTYGHDCGDHILIIIAQLLQGCVRETDLVARWGGEEFCMVCPASETATAQAMVARVQHILADTAIRWQKSEIHIRMTFGIAHHTAAQALDETIKQADIALYYGKQHGRNCCMLYDPIMLGDG